uniref:TMV resistance protein N-like n=1 Tax=Nicotiana tabacum TaxID=4097 RepID=A0A1S4BQ26_TOBAC|nr:PREDICTED: TMV resistance protein N-like [Nicotiana tabacum]
MSCMTQKLTLSEGDTESSDDSEGDTPIHFLLVPLAVLWDTSKANGKTPNDYGIIRLSFSGEMKEYGLRLLYKEEAEDEPTEHSNHDSVTDESTGSIAYEEHMFPWFVAEQVDSWPEKEIRERNYLGKNQLQMNVREARKLCQNGWMKEALELFFLWDVELN